MAYNQAPDCQTAEYSIRVYGDAVVGDHVRFPRARFGGSYRRPTFLGFEIIEAEIVSDSYGAEKQQHTFTIRLADGQKTTIKGRNLYREPLYRRPWEDESAREAARDEKHERGEAARAARESRRQEASQCW